MDTDSWASAIVERANGDDRFETATEQFDGSIAFDVGSTTLWFKIYRGRIIDTEPYVPMFGATFHLEGDEAAWTRLREGEASLSEQLGTGRMHTSGNTLEANRMRDATELMVRYLQAATEAADV